MMKRILLAFMLFSTFVTNMAQAASAAEMPPADESLPELPVLEEITLRCPQWSDIISPKLLVALIVESKPAEREIFLNGRGKEIIAKLCGNHEACYIAYYFRDPRGTQPDRYIDRISFPRQAAEDISTRTDFTGLQYMTHVPISFIQQATEGKTDTAAVYRMVLAFLLKKLETLSGIDALRFLTTYVVSGVEQLEEEVNPRGAVRASGSFLYRVTPTIYSVLFVSIAQKSGILDEEMIKIYRMPITRRHSC